MPYIIEDRYAVHTPSEIPEGVDYYEVSWDELDIRSPNEIPRAEDPLDRISRILAAFNEAKTSEPR